ncbi:DoxX family protein [Loktanella sp. SALINAS62]|uniref:DoxX family protein n=1 Tax=Loktanella sp. SALINAS62 TaxID=2706124 RepID=UPI002011EDCE|nr:DoxX family protein [Loktanella sp. SALINAS62]MBS1302934.1 DoxX family membrane protein [Loktanella sp. SALINAS62]
MSQTIAHSRADSRLAGLRRMVRMVNDMFGRLPWAVPALMARLIPAWVFWASARTKVDGFAIADSTWWLFENEYALPIIPAAAAAVLATVAEHVFAVTLALGFFTRLPAAALLGMTIVIQVFVYPTAWVTHGLWAACFLVIVARGPGWLSLDRLLRLDR